MLELNAAKVTPADVARTRHLNGVTAAAGPYPETTVTLTLAGGTSRSASGGGAVQQPVTVVGRRSSQGPLDDLVCFTSPPGIDSCGWPRRDDQLEVSSFAPVQLESGGGRLGPVGVRVAVTSLPGRPRLTVVGYAASNIQQDADAWALPAEVRALQRQGAPRQQQMLCTFANASTPSQFNADLSELRNVLPHGAIVSSATLSSAQRFSAASGSQRPPYTVTYAVIAILLTLLTVAIVAVAAVTGSYRRIAALKSIGFTPGEVGAACGMEIGAPAIIGAGIGVVIGASWAVRLINAGPEHIRVTAPLWVEILTFATVVALVAFAAVIPALRVARLPVVAVLSAGQSRSRGSRLAQLPLRLPLPRALAVGASAGAARPAPAVAIASVVALGIAAVVLAVGLDRSMVDLVVGATSPLNGSVVKGQQLVQRLTVIVSVVALMGVLSAVVMLARQRIRDLAVYKAVGMPPRQLVSTRLAWILTPRSWPP
jgi:putative ABC transport system permease protein